MRARSEAREMRPLSFTIGASLLPSFSLVAGAGKDCYGKFCNAVDEYCSTFAESCHPCSAICDASSHNHQADMCAKECADYNRYEPLKAEIQHIRSQQTTIILLLIVLLALIAIRYACKCLRWLRHKPCITMILKKLRPKHTGGLSTQQNGGKDLNATTIQNVMTIHDIERAPSQIYSVTGAAEGSVMTMTTPVSTRYPAENSTTPTTITTEYSYDNQALAVTPVLEKPNGTAVF